MRALDQKLTDDNFALVRGLHSLGGTHADAVRNGLARMAAGWMVEEHDDYDGDLILILVSNDPEAPAYVLSATKNGICLARVENDRWIAVSRVDTVAVALDLFAEEIGKSHLCPVPV